MAVHPASIWLDRNWQVLPAPGFWVAAVVGRIVAEDRDYDRMIAAVHRQRISLRDVVILQVPAEIVQ